MNLTALTLLGLATGLGQSPTPPAEAAIPVTSKKSFPIPVDVKAGRRAEIKSLQLWASRDNGQLWEIFDKQKNDKDALTFKDRGDGLYWVNMVTEYTDGRLDPPDVSQVVPAMKVVIDTVAPVVKVTAASRVGEDIALEWTVDDKNPNDAVTAVYLRAAATPDAQWQMAPPEAIQKRSAKFKTTIPGALVVTVVAADLARNSGSGAKEIAAGTTAGYTPPTPPAVDVGGPRPPVPPVLNREGPLPPPGDVAGPGGGPTEPVVPTELGPGPGVTPMTPTLPAPLRTQPPPVDPQPSVGGTLPAPAGTGPEPLRTLAPGADALPAPGLRPAAAVQPPPDVPPVQVLRQPRFDLGYQVDGGVSGVAKIVLYVTRDDGRNWKPWSTHDGKESPLKVALDTQFNRDVEGDYGFKLVPVSGAGLSDPAPPPNAPPDLKVHVDLTPPTVDIYAPQADPTNRNALVLIWKAADKNFEKDPILIEYGETVNGPWRSVTAGEPGTAAGGRLANTGSYSWSIPATLTTPQVYLRVTAWDLGGNKTERVTERPILVDLTRPRAKIVGIVVPPGR